MSGVAIHSANSSPVNTASVFFKIAVLSFQLLHFIPFHDVAGMKKQDI